jgi:hypothetical protein
MISGVVGKKIKAAARGALKHMMRQREGSTSFMAMERGNKIFVVAFLHFCVEDQYCTSPWAFGTTEHVGSIPWYPG